MGATTKRAFTLIDLLTAIGIIALLVAMLVPTIGRIRELALRATDLSNLRQLTAATIMYAQEHGGNLPAGRVKAASPGMDDYTWINNDDCWSQLVTLIPPLKQIISCASVRDSYPNVSDFGHVSSSYGYGVDTEVGWMYWGGRDDLYVAGQLRYRSVRKLGQHLTPGSQTLWTCWCWDSAGGGGGSICPHVGNKFVIYPNGTLLKPPPDGLGVALLDGSASFVPWNDLIIIPQYNGYKLYYQP